MTGLLTVDGLTVRFHTAAGLLTAVDDLSFTIDRGETLVIVGESGSGKSATSLAIMGLVPPPGRVTARAIRLRSKAGAALELTALAERQMQQVRGAEIAMIFQEPMTSLNPVHSIGEQVVEGLVFHERLSRRAARTRTIELFTRLGIPDAPRRFSAYPHELSGGMRQRAMIAMALACRPSLLIADEPTTALDATVQAQILALIRDMQREIGMAVLFITHHLGVAAEIADRIMVMYAGQAVETAPRDRIFRATRAPYTLGLMRSVPRLGRDHDGLLPALPGMSPDPLRPPAGCRFHPRCAFVAPGRCDAEVPALEPCEADHLVRCLRWREIAP
jgi:oligopeptide transport system ATP-binding protein